MNERLLQFLWQYQLFNNLLDFKTSKGLPIQVIKQGVLNTNQGTDFLMSKIKINDIEWNGNIEIHLKSSDFYAHNHQNNKDYQHIILHIVYEHDLEIPELEDKGIHTLELKKYLSPSIIDKYKTIIDNQQFIPCSSFITPELTELPIGFFERLYIEKLSVRYDEIIGELNKCNSNWEALFFQQIAYGLGLKVNASIFKDLAQAIDFKTVQKLSSNQVQLEALFFGLSDLLNTQCSDEYFKELNTEFDFIQHKYHLTTERVKPYFLRLRPPNFPTIRLSQLADLYSKNHHLFSFCMGTKNLPHLYQIFDKVEASHYWDNHFVFGKKTSKKQKKILTKDRINLLIINSILPIKYAYGRYLDQLNEDEIFNILQQLPAEKNAIIENYKNLGYKIDNALQSQGFLWLYKIYCSKKKCLNCQIGYEILKENII